MECELQSPEVLAAALQPIIYIVNESSVEEFQEFVLPFIKNIFLMPKSVQVSVAFVLVPLCAAWVLCLKLSNTLAG